MTSPISGTPDPANDPTTTPSQSSSAPTGNTNFLVPQTTATLNQAEYQALYGSIGLLPTSSYAKQITPAQQDTPTLATLSLTPVVNDMITFLKANETPSMGSGMMAGYLEGMLSGLSQLAPNSTPVSDAIGNINSMLNSSGVTTNTSLTTDQLNEAISYLQTLSEENISLSPNEVMSGYSAITGDLLKFAALPESEIGGYIPELAGVLTFGSMMSGYMGPGLSATFNTVIQMTTNQKKMSTKLEFYSYYLNALGFNNLENPSAKTVSFEGLPSSVTDKFADLSGKPYAKGVEEGLLSGLAVLDPMTSGNGSGSSWGDIIYTNLKSDVDAEDLYGRQLEEYDMSNEQMGIGPVQIPNMTPPEDQPQQSQPSTPPPTPPQLISGVTILQDVATQPAQISENALLAFADAASNMAAVGASSNPSFLAGVNLASTMAIDTADPNDGQQPIGQISMLANALSDAEMEYVEGNVTPLNNAASIETMGTVLNNEILNVETGPPQFVGLISADSVFQSLAKELNSPAITASNYQQVLQGVSGALANLGALESVNMTLPQRTAYQTALESLSSLSTSTSPDFTTAKTTAANDLQTMAAQLSTTNITVGDALNLAQAMFGTAASNAGVDDSGLSYGYYVVGVALAGADIPGVPADPIKAFGSMAGAISNNYETLLSGSGTNATANDLISNLTLLSQDVTLYQTNLETGDVLKPLSVNGTAILDMYAASILGVSQSNLSAWTDASLTILTMLKNSMNNPPPKLASAVAMLQEGVSGTEAITTPDQLADIVKQGAEGMSAVPFNVFVNIAQVALMQASLFLPTADSPGDPEEAQALLTFVQDLTVAPKSNFAASRILKKNVSTLATFIGGLTATPTEGQSNFINEYITRIENNLDKALWSPNNYTSAAEADSES